MKNKGVYLGDVRNSTKETWIVDIYELALELLGYVDKSFIGDH